MGLTIEQQKALALAQARRRRAESTGFAAGAEQLGSGLNEGISNFAGLPVDIMTGALNLGIGGANAVFGSEIPAIENPAGGSASLKSTVMDPFISDQAPATTAQRYLRRGGQEIGFGVPAALTGASLAKYGATAREAIKSYLGASVAGDVGAGIAGQTAREIAPESDLADFIASVLGGGGGAGLAAATTPRLAPTPTLEQVKQTAADKWASVKADPAQLTDAATDNLKTAVDSALPSSQLAPNAYPKAFATAQDIGALRNPTIYDVAEARRIAGDAVASVPGETKVGVDMKKAIQDYLNGMTPNDVSGGSVSAVDDLRAANRASHTAHKAEAILNKEMRGESRAWTSGTGGNEVNATRQNIRALFDKERDPTLRGSKQGYTPDEMAAMERVVKGSGGSNAARLLGRLSPTSGALPLMAMGGGGVSGATAAMVTGNPLLALPMAGAGMGMVAKSAAESMTKKDIEALLAAVLNGGKAPGASAQRQASIRAMLEQMLSAGAQ